MKTIFSLSQVFFLLMSLFSSGQGIVVQPNACMTIQSGAYIKETGAAGFVIKSTSSGTGSVIDQNSGGGITYGSGTVKAERYIVKDNGWHFLSSPVASAPIWPEFAPSPTGTWPNLTFGSSPWNWDFYYWNPNCPTSAGYLPWVNLRLVDGSFNTQSVEGSGNAAGFGTANNPAQFQAGRGYLVAYASDYAGSVTHNFNGQLNYGGKTVSVTNNSNAWNLAGNPYPSSIDWQASSGWGRSNLAGNDNPDGYDYWIFTSSGNYGVFNSKTGVGTNGTSRDIAPMQAFFVLASTSGNLTMNSGVQVHSNQSWLKETTAENNILRIKLTTAANDYSDEMIVAVDPSSGQGGGSWKLWGMYAEAPELYGMTDDGYYSIRRLPQVDGQTYVRIGVKAGIDEMYTVKITGTEGFTASGTIILEDVLTGHTQDIRDNPVYSFSAGPADPAERLHLHFGPTGINDNVHDGISFTVYAVPGSLIIRKDASPEEFTILVCNLLGQRIGRVKSRESLTRIDLDAPSGCYMVTVISGNRAATQKVLVR